MSDELFFVSNRELKYYRAHCKRQNQSLLRDRTGLSVDSLDFKENYSLSFP